MIAARELVPAMEVGFVDSVEQEQKLQALVRLDCLILPTSPEQLRGLCLAFPRDDACLIRSDNTRSAKAWEGSLFFPCFALSKQEAYAHAFATNHTAAENPTHGPALENVSSPDNSHAGPDFHFPGQDSALPLLVPSWQILEFRLVHHIRACWPALAYDSGQESFLIGLPRVRSENKDQMVPNKV
jgi:hypothetical protein